MNTTIHTDKLQLQNFKGLLTEVTIAQGTRKSMTLRVFGEKDGTLKQTYMVYDRNEISIVNTSDLTVAIARYNSLTPDMKIVEQVETEQ